MKQEIVLLSFCDHILLNEIKDSYEVGKNWKQSYRIALQTAELKSPLLLFYVRAKDLKPLTGLDPKIRTYCRRFLLLSVARIPFTRKSLSVQLVIYVTCVLLLEVYMVWGPEIYYTCTYTPQMLDLKARIGYSQFWLKQYISQGNLLDYPSRNMHLTLSALGKVAGPSCRQSLDHSNGRNYQRSSFKLHKKKKKMCIQT